MLHPRCNLNLTPQLRAWALEWYCLDSNPSTTMWLLWTLDKLISLCFCWSASWGFMVAVCVSTSITGVESREQSDPCSETPYNSLLWLYCPYSFCHRTTITRSIAHINQHRATLGQTLGLGHTTRCRKGQLGSSMIRRELRTMLNCVVRVTEELPNYCPTAPSKGL